jgi:hypothetical protein
MTVTARPVKSIDHDTNLKRPPPASLYCHPVASWRAFPRDVLFLPYPKSRCGIIYLSALVLTTADKDAGNRNPISARS